MIETAAALAPLVTVVVLMTVRGWPAWRAGLVGALLAWVAATTVFDLGAATGLGTGGATAGVAAEVASTAAGILWIVAPALCIYRLQVDSGAAATLRAALARLSPDPRIAGLLIAWFFALLLEGAAGFGTSAALAGPFLVAVGFTPVQAIAAALVGHAAGVSFGAVGTPVAVQVAAGLPAGPLAWTTALFHVVCGTVLVVALARIVGRAVPGDGRLWPWAALAGICFFVPFALVARFVGPELPTLAGALAGGAAFALVVSRRPHDGPPALREPVPVPAPALSKLATQAYGAAADRVTAEPAEAAAGAGAGASPLGDPVERMSVLTAAAPYLVLVAAVLVTRLVPAVEAATTGAEVGWGWQGFAWSIAPLHHPGTLLALAFVVGALVQRVPATAATGAVRQTVAGLGAVTVALVGMLALSRLLVHADMVQTLARSAAAATGPAWPLLAPTVGLLGTFVTGSATASNILLTDLQTATATELGAPVVPLAAAQGFGAAVGNIVCPHNVVAAGATVSLGGAEGEVLRRTVPAAAAYAAAGGLVALALVSLGA